MNDLPSKSPSSERAHGDQEGPQQPIAHPLTAGVTQHIPFTAPANMTSEELSAGDIGATSGATDDWTDRAAEAAIQYGGSSGGGGGGGGEVESSRLEWSIGGSGAVEGGGNVGNIAEKVLNAAATATAKSAYVGTAAGGKVEAAAVDIVHAVAGAKECVSQAAEYVGSTAKDMAERAEEVVAAAALRGEAAVREFEAGAEERAHVVREKVRSGAHELVDQGADAMMNVQGGVSGSGWKGEGEEHNEARRQ